MMSPGRRTYTTRRDIAQRSTAAPYSSASAPMRTNALRPRATRKSSSPVFCVPRISGSVAIMGSAPKSVRTSARRTIALRTSGFVAESLSNTSTTVRSLHLIARRSAISRSPVRFDMKFQTPPSPIVGSPSRVAFAALSSPSVMKSGCDVALAISRHGSSSSGGKYARGGAPIGCV